MADPRRQPALRGIVQGHKVLTLDAESGSVPVAPPLPDGQDVAATAAFTRAVLQGTLPVPAPIATQVQAIQTLHRQLCALPHAPALPSGAHA